MLSLQIQCGQILQSFVNFLGLDLYHVAWCSIWKEIQAGLISGAQTTRILHESTLNA